MDRITYFRDFLAKRPTDRFAAYSLALELKKAGLTEQAAEAFRVLLLQHPTSGAGHYQLGLLWQEAGDDDRARACWEAGLAALAGSTDPEERRSYREIQGALADL